jgi:hypothetical protein
MDKKKLLVSFSGGETSAYMAQWLWNNKQDEFEMLFVFANTGQENEETLLFVEQCSKHFGFPVWWVEALVNEESGKGTRHRIVDFDTANRTGAPFHDVIRKYGITNKNAPHCTRELKERPIISFAKSIGWKDWWTAIGIRNDEVDRVNRKWKKQQIYYPLVADRPMSKPKINFWWNQQPFRLQLKGYQGNCITCWKKSDVKLFTIAQENAGSFDFFNDMEKRYAEHIPPSRAEAAAKNGTELKPPFYFFRGNRNTEQMLTEAKEYTGTVKDDAQNYNVQFDLDLDGGSCEVFTVCGD